MTASTPKIKNEKKQKDLYAKEEDVNAKEASEPDLKGIKAESTNSQVEDGPKEVTIDLYGKDAGETIEYEKIIRIAVSGDVFITELERKIIDTPEFQRLRRLKQLCTTYIVYPSAVHTRFEHSLGVLQMAQHMINCIEQNHKNAKTNIKIEPWQRKVIRLAALLHDIGNIPFGHTLEDETCVVREYQEDGDRLNKFLKDGSNIGNLLIGALASKEYDVLKNVLCPLTKEEKKAIESDQDKDKKDKLIEKKLGKDTFIYDIVKNTVCADLLDYLRRDLDCTPRTGQNVL